MKCSLCDIEMGKGVKGPGQLFVCIECVDDLSVAEEVEMEGNCSFCGTKIGKTKFLSGFSKVQALAENPNNGIILCIECGDLCVDIVNNQD